MPVLGCIPPLLSKHDQCETVKQTNPIVQITFLTMPRNIYQMWQPRLKLNVRNLVDNIERSNLQLNEIWFVPF